MEWKPATREGAALVYAACPDYFLGLGQEPDLDELFEQGPAGKETWEAVVDGGTVGLVDFVAGYPNERTGYIGLLMVREDRRGRGYGREMAAWVETRMPPSVDTMRLAVLEGNEPGLAFWSALGFRDTGERKPYGFGSTVVLMEKSRGL